jgi:hypothetical protein
MRSNAQGGAFLEKRRSPGDRSLTVAALIGGYVNRRPFLKEEVV